MFGDLYRHNFRIALGVTPPRRKRPVPDDNFFRGTRNAELPEMTGEKALEGPAQRYQGQNNIARVTLFLCHELYCQETPI
ncbi:hypothetical protein K5D57_22465 [Pseudomonas cichorii]|nr:hypothetical protein [Pseudomonas cichorii]